MQEAKRKTQFIIDLVKDTDMNSPSGRALLFSTSRVLLDDIKRVIVDTDTSQLENFDKSYVLNQLSSFRAYIDYSVGLNKYDDVKPGDNEQAIHFGHKLLHFLPDA